METTFFSPKLNLRFDMRALQRLKMEWKHAENVQIMRYVENEAGLAMFM